MGRQGKKRTAPAKEPGEARGKRPTAALVVGLVALLVAGSAAFLLLRHPARPNLLLITIDTLRADHVGSYGYEAASTPTLDALAHRGIRFSHAESAVPLTGPSHSTIMTGLYPPTHRVRDNVTFVLDPSHPTLASLLKRAGYRTAAFVGAYPVAASLGFSQGFDEFEEGFHVTPVPGEGAERPANEVADSVLGFLGRTEEPFFVWMHVYDPHAPYRPPSPYRERFHERLYDGEIAFADAQLGRVMDALKEKGRDRRTLIVALGDHGESLGEHGEATHAILIYEATLRIPLLMAGPGVPEEGLELKNRVSTVDVLPTIAGLLGLKTPGDLPGRDLRPAFAGRNLPRQAQYAESLFGRLNCRWSSLRSVTEGDWKLINGAQPELYNLSDDPGETRDLSGSEKDRTRQMLQGLAGVLQKLAPQGDVARAMAIAPEQAERLRSLGYAGGGTGGSGALDELSLPDPRSHVKLYELLIGLLATPPDVAPRAADAANRIALEDPGNPFAYFTLASLAYHAGQFRRADEALRHCLSLDPDRPSIRAYRAQLLRDMGELEDSETELRIVLDQTTPDDFRTRISLAQTLTLARKFDEAGKLLGGVLAQAPHHIEALAAKGRLLLAEGKGKEALPFLQEATRDDDIEAWIEFGSAKLSVGDPAGAAEAARHALEVNPQHPWALAVLGQALFMEGQHEEGVSLLRKALSAGPRRPRVWESLASAFRAAGDLVTATRCEAAARASVRG